MMKNLFIVLALSGTLFAAQNNTNFFNTKNWMIQVQGSTEAHTNGDKLLVFEAKTSHRTNVTTSKLGNTLSGEPYEDISSMIFAINKDKKLGYMYDQTTSLNSFYKITDIVYSNGPSGYTNMISGIMRAAGSGNYYYFILNDNNKTVLMSGAGLNAIVIRKYQINN